MMPCLLTAFVLTALWRAVKKNASTESRVAQRLKEEKRSRCFVRTLLIKNFKYGSSLSIFVQKNNETQRSQSQSNFPHDNNTTAGFDSGLNRRKQRAKITDTACFVIFWGAKNIAGECSLKIPYSTIAVNTRTFLHCFVILHSFVRGIVKTRHSSTVLIFNNFFLNHFLEFFKSQGLE